MPTISPLEDARRERDEAQKAAALANRRVYFMSLIGFLVGLLGGQAAAPFISAMLGAP